MSKVTQIRQKARNFLQKGKYDKAIEEYKRLTGMETKNPNHLNELGDIYLKAGDSIQAVSSFEKAIVIYEKVALYNNAVAVCKKILRIIPGRIETIYKMGELRAKQKLDGEAKTCFSQYLDSIIADAESYGPELNEKILVMLELVPECEEIIIRAAAVFKLIGIKSGAFELYSKLASDAERDGDMERYQGYMQEAEGLRSSMSKDEIKGVEDSIARSATLETSVDDEAPAGECSEADAAVDEGAAPDEAPAAEEPVAEVEPEGAEEAAEAEEASGPEDAGDERPEMESEVPDIDGEEVGSGEEEETVEEYVIPSVDDEEAPTGTEGPVTEEHAAHEEPCVTDETVPVEEAPESGKEEPAQDDVAAESADDGEPVTEAAPDDAPAGGDEIEDGGTGEGGAGFDKIIEGDSSSGEAENLVEEITSDVEEDDHRSPYDLGMAYLEMALDLTSCRSRASR